LDSLLLRLGPRWFPRNFPSDYLGNFFSNHLRGGLLLGSLPKQEKKHKGNQQDYDQDQGGHQHDSSGTHTSPFASFAAYFPLNILGQREKRVRVEAPP
jgi:hypothetical protein